MLFSDRLKLAELIKGWASETSMGLNNNVSPDALGTIDFLYREGLLDEEAVLKILNEKTIEEKIHKKYYDFRVGEKPKYLILGTESFLSLQKSVGPIQSQLNSPRYMEMRIAVIKDEDKFYIDVVG